MDLIDAWVQAHNLQLLNSPDLRRKLAYFAAFVAHLGPMGWKKYLKELEERDD